MKYIAKTETWFDAMTHVELIDDYRPQVNSGLFQGYVDGKLDEEVCSFDEFEELPETVLDISLRKAWQEH